MLNNQELEYVRQAFDTAAKNSKDTLAVALVLSDVFQKITIMNVNAESEQSSHQDESRLRNLDK